MKQEIIEFICAQQSALTNLPLRIYRGQNLVRFYQTFEMSLPTFDKQVEAMLTSEKAIFYTVTAELLQFGMLREKENGFTLIIGPVKAVPLKSAEIQKIALQNKIPLDKISELTTYLNSALSMNSGSFILFLQLLYAIVNEEILPSSAIITATPDMLLEDTVNQEFMKTSEAIAFGEKDKPVSYDYESKLLYYISHGMVEKLKSFNTANLIDNVGKTATDQIRHNKNIVLISNSLSSRAAIKGGLNAEAVYRLAEIYAQKIEACSSFQELHKLSQHLRLDYCTRVRNHQYEHIDDLLVGKAVKYIHDHLCEKISCAEIASFLNITPEYLTSKFKKTMHLLPSEFITQLKIKEAQYLLLYTDQTLAHISAYLSFSSQSYFQNVFKKIVGTTPLEFRNHGHDQFSSI